MLEQIIKLMFTDSARLDSFLFMIWSRQVLIRGVVFFQERKGKRRKISRQSNRLVVLWGLVEEEQRVTHQEQQTTHAD